MLNQSLLKNFQGFPAANSDDLRNLEEALAIKLPLTYRNFLIHFNGGEGFIGNEGYVQLWGTKEIVSLNDSYQVNEYAPGILLIGSNGGGEAYGFDFRKPQPPVIEIPFVGMDIDLAQEISPDFDSFFIALANQKKRI